MDPPLTLLADRICRLITLTIQSHNSLLSISTSSDILYPARPYFDTHNADAPAIIQWYSNDKARRILIQDCLILANRPEILERLPLSTNNRPALGDYNLTRDEMSASLLREQQLLTALLCSLETTNTAPPYNMKPEMPQALPTQDEWRRNGWSERLRRARLKNGHAQKQAATACNSNSVETYKKWEQGRTPAERNIPAIVEYIIRSERRQDE